MKAGTKLTVVMCCHIFDRRSVAPSSGDFLRRPPPSRRPWCDKSTNVWRCGITHFVWSQTVCHSDIPNRVADSKTDILQTDILQSVIQYLTLFHIVTRSIFSQIKKLNFVYCWCFDMFYYTTFFIHQNFRTDLTCMWVQFKLKYFVLNH